MLRIFHITFSYVKITTLIIKPAKSICNTLPSCQIWSHLEQSHRSYNKVWVRVTFSDFPGFPVKILKKRLNHRLAREICNWSCFLDSFLNRFYIGFMNKTKICHLRVPKWPQFQKFSATAGKHIKTWACRRKDIS